MRNILRGGLLLAAIFFSSHAIAQQLPDVNAAYTFTVSGGNVTTANPQAGTGLPLFSSNDFCQVWSQVTATLASFGGRLFIKNPPNQAVQYQCNSLTVENTGSCTNIAFALGFPANTLANSVIWIVEGEAMPMWMGESLATSIVNSGTIIHITQAAINQTTSGVLIAGFWQRPLTNCSLSLVSNASNEIHYKNLALRFPTNQRGNECGFCNWFTQAHEHESITADFDLPYNTIASFPAPTPGTQGSFGITSSIASTSNYQRYNNTYTTGWDVGYDLWEHINGGTMTAIYCNNAGFFGRTGATVFHPGYIEHFVDQENTKGFTFGSALSSGGPEINMFYDIEANISAAWYNRQGNIAESSVGTVRGTLWFTEVQQGVGLISNPIITQNGSNLTTIQRGIPSPGLFAVLPTCNAAREGLRRSVTDSTTVVYGAVITGTGANHIPAYCNGTNWVVD